jgi:hypothetical protein
MTDSLADVLAEVSAKYSAGYYRSEDGLVYMELLARAAREHVEGPVRALHSEVRLVSDLLGVREPYCSHDGQAWPCPTIRALGGTDD